MSENNAILERLTNRLHTFTMWSTSNSYPSLTFFFLRISMAFLIKSCISLFAVNTNSFSHVYIFSTRELKFYRLRLTLLYHFEIHNSEKATKADNFFKSLPNKNILFTFLEVFLCGTIRRRYFSAEPSFHFSPTLGWQTNKNMNF